MGLAEGHMYGRRLKLILNGLGIPHIYQYVLFMGIDCQNGGFDP